MQTVWSCSGLYTCRHLSTFNPIIWVSAGLVNTFTRTFEHIKLISGSGIFPVKVSWCNTVIYLPWAEKPMWQDMEMTVGQLFFPCRNNRKIYLKKKKKHTGRNWIHKYSLLLMRFMNAENTKIGQIQMFTKDLIYSKTTIFSPHCRSSRPSNCKYARTVGEIMQRARRAMIYFKLFFPPLWVELTCRTLTLLI